MRQDFAPKGIGKILDEAIELYRRNAGPLALAAVCVAGPAALIVSIAQVFYTRGWLAMISSFGGGDLGFAPENIAPLSIAQTVSSVATPLYSLAIMYVSVAVLTAAPALHAGERRGFRDLMRNAWKRFPYFLGVQLLLSMAVSFGTLFLVVPGIVVGIRFALAPAVTVLEGSGVTDSFKRSWELTRTHWWRVVVFSVLLGIVNFAVQGALNSPAAIRQLVDSIQDPQAVFRELSWGWKVLEGLLSAASVSLALPFGQLAWYLFYVDTRARTEGLDLLVRARSMAGPAEAPVASPGPEPA